jgi:hypothetical protein
MSGPAAVPLGVGRKRLILACDNRRMEELDLVDDAALVAKAQKGEEDLRQMDRSSVRYAHERTMRTDYPNMRKWC